MGLIKWLHGCIHTREWKDDERHDSGKMKKANGDVYDEEWVGDCMHGKGAFPSGSGEMSTKGCGSHPNQDMDRVVMDGRGCVCLVGNRRREESWTYAAQIYLTAQINQTSNRTMHPLFFDSK